MKSLDDTLADLEREGWARDPFMARMFFFQGAAAMAEQFAASQGSLALMVKRLSIVLAREAQALHTRLRELENKVDPSAER